MNTYLTAPTVFGIKVLWAVVGRLYFVFYCVCHLTLLAPLVGNDIEPLFRWQQKFFFLDDTKNMSGEPFSQPLYEDYWPQQLLSASSFLETTPHRRLFSFRRERKGNTQTLQHSIFLLKCVLWMIGVKTSVNFLKDVFSFLLL